MVTRVLQILEETQKKKIVLFVYFRWYTFEIYNYISLKRGLFIYMID